MSVGEFLCTTSQIEVGAVLLKVLLNQVPHLPANAAQDSDFSEINCIMVHRNVVPSGTMNKMVEQRITSKV